MSKAFDSVRRVVLFEDLKEILEQDELHLLAILLRDVRLQKITNKELYRRTNEIPWSTAITRRRLRWTGHLLRLPEEAPAKQALLDAIRKNKLPIGGQRTTWLKRVNKDLTTTGVNIKDRCTWHVASDREQWRTLTECAMSDQLDASA
ncbi:uncharacterized protein LOC119727203 [Patiria miniata]|uniref:Endonuclease-reverse transcriptase n=1 Tax=Patiria miniata TaxID=46514 RepID=A0A913ZTR4_PATMI|nr:uncharacterized protein LOC119727203 [Patiria miniata]